MKASKVSPPRKSPRKPRVVMDATVRRDSAKPSVSDYRAWRDELLK